MRYSTVIYLASILTLVVIVIGGVYIGASDDVQRHHQHLERPSEADLGECLRCSDNEFCTHLPIIAIDTFGQTIPGRPIAFEYGGRVVEAGLEAGVTTAPDGESEIEVSVRVIDNHGDWSHVTDASAHESMATMRIRGNSSRFFDKPNYRIHLTDSLGYNNPLPLLGMNSHHEWALHGPFLDKTLMRNYVWMNIAAEVMGPDQFVPEVRFFELILNGEYRGVYVLVETIRVSPERIPLNRHRQGVGVTSYLARLDWHTHTPERKTYTFNTHTLRLEGRNTLEVLYPRLPYQNDEVLDYVARSISIIERLLYSPEIIWYSRIYEQYIDVNSFVNFFIINEFIGNKDLFAGSTFFHKDVRGRLVAGPVWDFNNVMNNFMLDAPYDEFMLADRGWYSRLLACEEFTNRVIRRWHDLRRGALAEERLMQYMQDVEDWLGSAIDRNFEVWGYSFDPFQVNSMQRRRPTYDAVRERADIYEGMSARAYDNAMREANHEMIREMNPTSFEEAVAWHREFTIARGRWLDDYIVTLRQFSHPSRHALWTLQ